MYKRLHHRLTLFCCIIINIILFITTVFILKTIYDNLNLHSFSNFQKNVNGIYQELFEHENISHSWLRDLSLDENLIISILDNDIPIMYDKKKETSTKSVLIEKARQKAIEHYSLNHYLNSQLDIYHTEFEISNNSIKYFSSVGYISKAQGTLKLTILFPVPSLFSSTYQVFLPIIIISFLAATVLSAGSFLLIGKLIKPLIKSQTSQNNFFAAASHELRSPLSVITTTLPILKTIDSEDYLSAYSRIEKECIRMRRLVNDIFTLASLDNGIMAIHKSYTDIYNLLLESYENFETVAAKKEIQIYFALPDMVLPQINCDAQRITQVLQILLDNAISYTPPKGKIHIDLKLQFHSIYIIVSDNGPGIPDAEKSHVFERFYRCDSSRTDKNHFGLGLSIAKEIATLHQGSLSVSDSPENGAKFTLVLPLT